MHEIVVFMHEIIVYKNNYFMQLIFTKHIFRIATLTFRLFLKQIFDFFFYYFFVEKGLRPSFFWYDNDSGHKGPFSRNSPSVSVILLT